MRSVKRGQSSTLLYTLIIVFWIVLCSYFNWGFIKSFQEASGIISKTGIVLFVFCLNLFWFYSIYHLFFSLSSICIRFFKTKNIPLQPDIEFKPIAILYTTCDDFNESALLTCLHQDYNLTDVFILDDSSLLQSRQEIDQFIKKNQSVKLIRRQCRAGFKAGNLNHALQLIQHDYPYFALCDADTHLPHDFLSQVYPIIIQDPNTAFVQCKALSLNHQKSLFAQTLKWNNDLHWEYYVPAKEQFGFMMFYGHGAILRTNIWKKAGGFPEIATEDLAFSSRVREAGYYGKYASFVTCYEEYPQTYSQFRARERKWITGTLEYLFKYYPSLLKSKKTSWTEKLDILVSAGILFLSVPFLIYMMVSGFVLVLSQNLFRLNIPLYVKFPIYTDNIFDFLQKTTYEIYWSKELFLIMLIATFTQALPAFIHLFKKPIELFRYLALFCWLTLSNIISSTTAFMEFFFLKTAYFPVTGQKKTQTLYKKSMIIADFILGICLLCWTFYSHNLWILTISISLLTSLSVHRFNFDRQTLNFILYMPFIINLLILILIGKAI